MALALDIVALVSGVTGAALSVWNAARVRSLERFKSELRREEAGANARLDYEYEARKRLYGVYEPLRVRLLASTDNAVSQIADLAAGPACARTTETSPEYWLKAAMYYLLAPLVVSRMIERQLTLVDLGLDDRIHTEFVLAQVICRSLADEAHAAQFEPHLLYPPYVPGRREQRETCPQEFRRQGLPLGRLNTALDALHIVRSEGTETLMSFGEFEPLVDRLDVDDVRSGPGAARDLIVDFDPISRPVLWRVFVIQTLLYWCFQQTVFGVRLSEDTDLGGSFVASDMYRRLKDAVEVRPDADQVEPLETTLTVALSYFSDRVVPGLRRVRLLARAPGSTMK
jgi:hypothetical protein